MSLKTMELVETNEYMNYIKEIAKRTSDRQQQIIALQPIAFKAQMEVLKEYKLDNPEDWVNFKYIQDQLFHGQGNEALKKKIKSHEEKIANVLDQKGILDKPKNWIYLIGGFWILLVICVFLVVAYSNRKSN